MGINYGYLPNPADVITTSYQNGITFYGELKQSTKKTLNDLIGRVFKIFLEVFKNSEQLSRALSITRNIIAPQTKFYDTLALAEGLIDVCQTPKSLVSASSRDFSDISFGIANLANAALWLRQYNIELLANASAAIGSPMLEKISTGSLVLGFAGFAIQNFGEIKDIEAENKSKSPSSDTLNKLSNKQWKIACSLGEIALLVLPMSAPIRTCTQIVVKSVEIYVNLPEKNKGG